MKIFVYTDKKGFSLPVPAKTAKELETLPLSELPRHDPDSADIAYIDCAGMEKAALRKACALLKKLRADQAWGVIDPKGTIADPAGLFHDDSSDYIGPQLLKAGLEGSRFARVVDYANPPISSADDFAAGSGKEKPFPGWKALKHGESREFYFLYAAIADAVSLKAKIGDKRFGALRERFLGYLSQTFSEAEGQAWMQDDSGILFLAPPLELKARGLLQSCLRLILNTPLIGYEVFGLESPFNFVFALHKGLSPYQPPGKTGTVVSEDVNYIFHLGTKKAEPARIYVSSKAACAIPPRFSGHFLPAGRFEGYEICKSRQFQ